MCAACDHVALTTDNVSSMIGRRKRKYALFRIEGVSRYFFFFGCFFSSLKGRFLRGNFSKKFWGWRDHKISLENFVRCTI